MQKLNLKMLKLKKTVQVVVWNSLDRRTKISPALIVYQNMVQAYKRLQTAFKDITNL